MSIPDIPADLNEFYGSMISMDDPRHAKIRRIVSKVFTPRMLEQVMDSVQQIVEDVLDAARRKAEDGDGSIDVVADIAAPIPLRVICDMMGVPDEDRALILATSNIILSGGDPELVEDQDDPLTAFLEAGHGAGRRHGAAGGRAARAPDRRPDHGAGHDRGGRREALAAGDRLVLHPAAGGRQRDDAQRDLPGHPRAVGAPGAARPLDGRPLADRTAVEEIVRWTSPITWMRRTATQDGEVDGYRFSAGDKFLLFYAAANRDPARLRRPAACSTSPATPTRTSASAGTGRTSASARTWPGGRSP